MPPGEMSASLKHSKTPDPPTTRMGVQALTPATQSPTTHSNLSLPEIREDSQTKVLRQSWAYQRKKSDAQLWAPEAFCRTLRLVPTHTITQKTSGQSAWTIANTKRKQEPLRRYANHEFVWTSSHIEKLWSGCGALASDFGKILKTLFNTKNSVA